VLRDDEPAPGDYFQLILPPPVATVYAAKRSPMPPPEKKKLTGVLKVPPHQIGFAGDRPRGMLRSRVRSVGNRKMRKRDRKQLAVDLKDLEQTYRRRPKTWGDCLKAVRGPCPWVSCRHHLFLEVDPDTGALTINFPGLEPEELIETCALRVVQRTSSDGGFTGRAMTLEKTGRLLNLTLERVRQILKLAQERARARHGND
jgi:hypothetical protein